MTGDQWEDEARRLHDQLYGVDAGIDETRHNHQVLAAALRAAYDAGVLAAIDDCERVLSATPVRDWAMPYKSQAMARLGILRKEVTRG